MKASHSAIERYSQCSMSYYWHYVRKIRPTWTTSALLFGSAIDLAINELLLKTNKNPYDTFVNAWTTCKINNEEFYAPTCTKIVYTTKDFDIDLFTHETYAEISQRIKSGEVKEFDYDELVIKKSSSGWNSFSEDEKKYFNLINWISLREKSKYLIEAYKTDILPKIKNVIAVQKEIKADNGNGDTLVGFIDFVAELEQYGKVILDNKTSANPYKWDKVRTSGQLALYSHMESETFGTKKIGFIVLVKNLKKDKIKTCQSCGHVTESTHKTCNNEIENKRCGGEFTTVVRIRAATQIMVEDVLQEMEDQTLDKFDATAIKINAGEFHKVDDVKECLNVYGSRCPFYSLCHEDKMDGLVELPKDVK